MSRPKFLVDHNVHDAIPDGVTFREVVVDIVLARDVGLQETPDDQLLEFANQDGRILVTSDVNTMPEFIDHRVKRGLHTHGVIFVRQGADIGATISELLLIWHASEDEEWIDRTE